MRLVAPLLWLECLAMAERRVRARACGVFWTVDRLGLEAKSHASRIIKLNGKFSPIDLETIRPITGILLAIEEVAHCQLASWHIQTGNLPSFQNAVHHGARLEDDVSEHHRKTADLTPSKPHVAVLEIHRRVF